MFRNQSLSVEFMERGIKRVLVSEKRTPGGGHHGARRVGDACVL